MIPDPRRDPLLEAVRVFVPAYCVGYLLTKCGILIGWAVGLAVSGVL